MLLEDTPPADASVHGRVRSAWLPLHKLQIGADHLH
jgi:hypothetical protein